MIKGRGIIILSFLIISVFSALQINKLQFSFNFEQFFPEGDADLKVFQDFISEFGADDNFLLVAVRNRPDVFEQKFLEEFHDLTLESRNLPHVLNSQSLTKISFPIKTPFGFAPLPAIHIDDPSRYEKDKNVILGDERFVYNLITKDAGALVLYLKIVNGIQLEQATELMKELETLISGYDFDTYHFLGRPYFQRELVEMQKRELVVSALASGILVTLIMFLIFRKPAGIVIALTSIGIGMLLFIGFMAFSGRELSAMSALYPVLMIIVGTSDVIHIMSKYIDELRKGESRRKALRTTIREIGLATLLTSITTAIGFATLLTSKVAPIREFGLNAALGVLIAYITVIFFTTALLSYFDAHQLIRLRNGTTFWEELMRKSYFFTITHSRGIAIGGLVVLLVSFIGISKISTNYSILKNMPVGEKITQDFRYFEENLTGFRPMEIAVFARNQKKITDLAVLREIDKVEQFLKTEPSIKATTSITSVYKSVNRMLKNNAPGAYRLPDEEREFNRLERWVDKIPENNVNILVNKDQTKARISSRLMDIGADSIKYLGQEIDGFINANTDTSIVRFQQTGTGLIIDKNSEYVRRSLILGLGIAIVIVSLLMVLLFQNFWMLIISLLPNFLPLLIAGALLGYIGIELEAGISIVFAVIFGIAVDDTIHFLAKLKLTRRKGHSLEESLKITFLETGKAICLTTIILFFGFLIMLFSIHPPSIIVGMLISVTLFSALFSDLLFIPLLARWLLKE